MIYLGALAELNGGAGRNGADAAGTHRHDGDVLRACVSVGKPAKKSVFMFSIRS